MGEDLSELFKAEYLDAGYQMFEKNLAAAELLEALEQAGVLPPATLPDQRAAALRYLYLGAMLDHICAEVLIIPYLLINA
ncbi:MAG: hypothetical protein AB1801_08320 [Chloroflexota bacterium]